jgi:hypothetical protein
MQGSPPGRFAGLRRREAPHCRKPGLKSTAIIPATATLNSTAELLLSASC